MMDSKRQRYLKTAIAVAACQLLFACAKPQTAYYASHFNTDAVAEYEFSKPADTAGSKEKDESQAARVMQGTGKVLDVRADKVAVTGSPVKLSFEEAPLAQVVQTVLGDILKVDYVLHPPIGGSVTMSTQKPVPAQVVLDLLETALQASGLVMVRDIRGVYHIGSAEALRSIGATVRVAAAGQPLAPGYGVVVVPLQYIGAAEMAGILRPIAGENAILRVDSVRNLLVMAGTRGQAEGWLEMVRTFDIDLLEGMSVGVFPLKYISIEEVTEALQLMSGAGGAAAAAPAAPAGQPGRTPARTSGAGGAGVLTGALHIMPIERLNSILVITPRPAYLEQVKRWVAKFDQAGAVGGQAQLHIYQVQNGNAKHLANVLAGIFGGETTNAGTRANSGVAPGLATASTAGIQGATRLNSNMRGNSAQGLRASGLGMNSSTTGTTGNQAAVSQGTAQVADLGGIRVMADELNNSVLIWGTPAEYERIEASLRKLDVPPTQILIEASIIEVTLNDSLRYGLEWTFNNSNHGGYSGSGSVSGGTTSFGGSIGKDLASGFTYTVRNSLGNVRAVLNALSSKTDLKVVASPSLMVLDNHTASINVGTQQPYQTGSTFTGSESNVITSSIEYKDTGVNLSVTPTANAGNMVTMSVDQTVTDVGPQDEVTKQRSFLQRQVSSRVAVRSGETIVMGGLIQENNSAGRSGVPLLHDLPVVGHLFGSTNKTGARTELLVVITPRVVRTDIDIRSVTNSLRDQMVGLRDVVHPESAQPDSVETNPSVLSHSPVHTP